MNDAVRRDDADLPLHPHGGESDADVLAEYSVDVDDGGVLPDEVAAHLAGCGQCRATLDALLAVRTELRAAAAPMPAAVSRRVTAALSDLAPGTRSGRHREPAQDEFSSAWRRRQRLRAMSSVAAGVIVLGGGGYLVVTGAGSIVNGAGDSESGAGGADNAGPLSVDEDFAGLPAYDRDSLRAAVGDLLAGPPAAEGDGVDTSSTEGVPDSAATAVEPDCLASLPVATGAALSITRATYDGQSAIVLLFAAPSGQVQVTVLSDCSDGDPRVLDEFAADR